MSVLESRPLEPGGSNPKALFVALTGYGQAHDRVLARTGMTAEKFEHILALQMPDAQKRARADFVIDTGIGLEETRGQVRALISCILGREGR